MTETTAPHKKALHVDYGPLAAQNFRVAANPFTIHFGYTASTLEKALRETGFGHVEAERGGECTIWAVAPPTALGE